MLEVYEEESPGEPMKPLSELREELLKFADACDERGTNYWHPFGNGVRNSAALLQAWLGEADTFLAGQRVDFSMSAFTVDMLRANLLGTTRQEGRSDGLQSSARYKG